MEGATHYPARSNPAKCPMSAPASPTGRTLRAHCGFCVPFSKVALESFAAMRFSIQNQSRVIIRSLVLKVNAGPQQKCQKWERSPSHDETCPAADSDLDDRVEAASDHRLEQASITASAARDNWASSPERSAGVDSWTNSQVFTRAWSARS